jgi:L-fuconolactonase
LTDERLTRRSLLKAGLAAGLALGAGFVKAPEAFAQSAPAGMRGIVDAQAYTSDVWYLPVESLLGEMSRAGVERAVLVQYEGEIDNDYQFDAVRRYPGRFANVVAIDYQKPDAPATLAALAKRGASGVRIPASVHSPGSDPQAIWKAAADLNLPVSCPGTPADFASDWFGGLIAAFPHLTFVIEHAGGAYGSQAPLDALRKVYALASRPNAYIKIGGISEFDRRLTPVVEPFPFAVPLPPVLDLVYAAFGPKRMMWGSDYPPVAGKEGYHNALGYTFAQFKDKSADDRAWIFGRTAASVFAVSKA